MVTPAPFGRGAFIAFHYFMEAMERQIGVGALGLLKALFAVIGGGHVMAGRLQPLLDQRVELLFVINDEDPGHGGNIVLPARVLRQAEHSLCVVRCALCVVRIASRLES